MTPEKLNEIKARTDAATPEPWYHQQTFSGQHFVGEGPSDAPTPLAFMHGSFAEPGRNADFIAAARSDIPLLLQEVEHLTAENARLQVINEAQLEACKLALAEMQNTDAYMEAQAIAEGKHGIYNPFFVDEIRALKAAIAGEPAQPVKTARSDWSGEG